MAILENYTAAIRVLPRKGNTVQEEYDHATHLRQQLLSIKHQSCPPSELIIYQNQGLTPHQIDEIQHFIRYNDLPFKVVIKKVNYGENEKSYLDDLQQSATYQNGYFVNSDLPLPYNAFFSEKSALPENGFTTIHGTPIGNGVFDRNVLANVRVPHRTETSEWEGTAPISVLMTAYKGSDPAQLNQTMLSILYQTTPPAEVVLNLDGPMTEPQMKIIETYERASALGTLPFNFVVVRNGWETNRGYPVALNAGLQHCSEKWIARMDVDDVCLPNRFELQWDALRQAEARGEPIDILSSSINYFEEDPATTHGTIIMPEYHEAVFERFRFLHAIYHPTIIFNRDKALEVGGYDESYTGGAEDFNLWQRLLEKGARLGSVQDPTVNIRADQAQAERRAKAWPFIKRCFVRAFSNGWLSEQEYDAAMREHTHRVNGGTDYSHRKNDRSKRFGINWPQSRNRGVHPKVLENRLINPEHPMDDTPHETSSLTATSQGRHLRYA